MDLVALTSRCVAALYWGEDAAEFRPERFIDTESYQWPRDACEHDSPVTRMSARLTFLRVSFAVLDRCKVVHRSAICICGNDWYSIECRASIPGTGSGRPREKAL